MGVPGGMPGTAGRRWSPRSPRSRPALAGPRPGSVATTLPVALAALVRRRAPAGRHGGHADLRRGEPVRDNAQLVERAAALATHGPAAADDRQRGARPAAAREGPHGGGCMTEPMIQPRPDGRRRIDRVLGRGLPRRPRRALARRGARAAPRRRAGGGRPLLHPPAAAGPDRHRSAPSCSAGAGLRRRPARRPPRRGARRRPAQHPRLGPASSPSSRPASPSTGAASSSSSPTSTCPTSQPAATASSQHARRAARGARAPGERPAPPRPGRHGHAAPPRSPGATATARPTSSALLSRRRSPEA